MPQCNVVSTSRHNSIVSLCSKKSWTSAPRDIRLSFHTPRRASCPVCGSRLSVWSRNVTVAPV